MGSSFFLVFMLDGLFSSADWGDSEELLSELWSKLPHDLVMKVLLRLPAASHARFQAVCKAWKHLLSSGKFKEESAAISFLSGLYICGFVYVHVDSFTPADECREQLEVHYKVHKLSLAALPEQPEECPVQDCYTGRRFQFCGGEVEVTSKGFSDGNCCQGLILLKYARECYEGFGSEDTCLSVNIVVFNPLNNTWRQLPTLQMPLKAYPEVRLTADGADFQVSVSYRTYTVPTMRNPDLRITGDFTFVYSTLANEWMSSARAEANQALTTLPRFKLALPDNCTTYVVRGETLLIPVLPNKCEVWGLHPSKRHWVLVSSLPDDMMAQIRGPRNTDDSETDEWGYLSDWGYSSEEEPEASRVVSDEGIRHRRIPSIDESKDAYIVAIELVGDVFFFTMCGGGYYVRQIVAYHVVKQLWRIVLCDHPPPKVRPPARLFICSGALENSTMTEVTPARNNHEPIYEVGPRYAWQRKVLDATPHQLPPAS